jgi:hypothetical protein
MTLAHHRGRTSSGEYVTPMMYLADDGDPRTIYVFASKAGAPTNPDWYLNLKTACLAQKTAGIRTIPVLALRRT